MVDIRALGVVAALFALAAAGPARAADCPGNPNALGTSRTLYVDPTEHIRLGMMQYSETLPLADHEVVLTFDDGPLPPYTTHVLKTLASECVKATFFLVGRMATNFPESVRAIHAAGHTIGTHSQNHPLRFHHMTTEQINQEVEGGISSVATALGNRDEVAPFFRVPGLLRNGTVEHYLSDKTLMNWSADFPADDWLRISDKEIAARALRRIEARGRGMLLLHDIKPATALALPTILQELKKRGYRIVHVVPASAGHPKTVTRTADWAVRRVNMAAFGKTVPWPPASLVARMLTATPALPIPDRRNFDLGPAARASQPVADRTAYNERPADPSWPPVETLPTEMVVASAATLPVPEANTFGIGKNAVPIVFAVKRHAVGQGEQRRPAKSPSPRQADTAATNAHPRKASPQPPVAKKTGAPHIKPQASAVP